MVRSLARRVYWCALHTQNSPRPSRTQGVPPEPPTTPMFDPADLGPLDATRWDERLVERLSELIPYDADELLSYVAKESNRQALDYIKDDGQRIIIPITPAPVRFTARQVQGLRDAFEV